MSDFSELNNIYDFHVRVCIDLDVIR